MNENNSNHNEHLEEVLGQFDGKNEDSYVYLADEEGNEYPFEFLDVITYNDVDYAIFFPAAEEGAEDDDEEDGVVILQVIPNDDGSVDFITPEAEDSVLDEVFDIFMANVRRQFELEMGEEVAHTEDNAGDSEK